MHLSHHRHTGRIAPALITRLVGQSSMYLQVACPVCIVNYYGIRRQKIPDSRVKSYGTYIMWNLLLVCT